LLDFTHIFSAEGRAYSLYPFASIDDKHRLQAVQLESRSASSSVGSGVTDAVR